MAGAAKGLGFRGSGQHLTPHPCYGDILESGVRGIYFSRDPYNKDYRMLGSILGSSYLGEATSSSDSCRVLTSGVGLQPNPEP